MVIKRRVGASLLAAIAVVAAGVLGIPQVVAGPVNCGRLLSVANIDPITKCHRIKGAKCWDGWWDNEYNWEMTVEQRTYTNGVIFACSPPKAGEGCCTLFGNEAQMQCPESNCAVMPAENTE